MGSESLKLPNPWCLKPRNSLNESSGSGQHIHQPPPPPPRPPLQLIVRLSLLVPVRFFLYPGFPNALIVHIFLSKTAPEPALEYALDRRPCSPPSLARPCQDDIHRGSQRSSSGTRKGRAHILCRPWVGFVLTRCLGDIVSVSKPATSISGAA